MRLAEVLSAVPSLLLVILIEGLMGWGGGNFLYAIAIAAAPSFLRLMRASVMNVMGREYIEAARALGVSPAGIIRWHAGRRLRSGTYGCVPFAGRIHPAGLDGGKLSGLSPDGGGFLRAGRARLVNKRRH